MLTDVLRCRQSSAGTLSNSFLRSGWVQRKRLLCNACLMCPSRCSLCHRPSMRPRGSAQCSRATPPSQADKLHARWLTASALCLSIDSQRARKKSGSLSTCKRDQALDMSQRHEDDSHNTFSNLCEVACASLSALSSKSRSCLKPSPNLETV